MRIRERVVLLLVCFMIAGCGADENDNAGGPGEGQQESVNARHFGAWRMKTMGGEDVNGESTVGIVFRSDGTVLTKERGELRPASLYLWDSTVEPQRLMVLESARNHQLFHARFTDSDEMVLIPILDPESLLPGAAGNPESEEPLRAMRRTAVFVRDNSILEDEEVASSMDDFDAISRGELPIAIASAVPDEIDDVVPVSGTVTLDGEPLGGATVSFLPFAPADANPAARTYRIASAVTDNQGAFQLHYQRVPRPRHGQRPGSLPDQLDGIPPGRYKVVVQSDNGTSNQATNLPGLVMHQYEQDEVFTSVVEEEGKPAPLPTVDSIVGVVTVVVGGDGRTVELAFETDSETPE